MPTFRGLAMTAVIKLFPIEPLKQFGDTMSGPLSLT